jgi:hypothetical protein
MQEGCRGGLGSFVRTAVGSLGAMMLLGSLAYATPIVDLSASDLHTSTMPVAASTMHNAVQAATGSARDGGFYALGMASSQISSSTCTIAGDCRATTKVPEPQSLMLVGSGLLSLAGFIRRRLAR